MAEVAAVRVCLSRPAVSKANDLPWNLDNLSARLQSRERERDLHLFQVSLRSFSLFRFLSLSPSATSAPPICIHPSRFKQRRYQLHRGCPDPLLIVRRCSAVWMEPEEWNVSPTTSSFSLSLFECEWCRAGTRKNFRLRSKKECLTRCGRIFEMFDKDFLFIFGGLLLLRI